MRLRDGILLIGVAASLVLAVTLFVSKDEKPARAGVDGAGTRLGSGSDASAGAEGAAPAAAGGGAASRLDSMIESLDALPAADASPSRKRAAAEQSGDEGLVSPAERQRRARAEEARYAAEFEALRAEQGQAALEGAVRAALASGRDPLARRVAGLRALQRANVAGLDLLLRSIVEHEADLSDGVSTSLPRTALKLLFERAPTEEGARRVLARTAFVGGGQLDAELRAKAAQALVASIRGDARAEAERLLRAEASGEALERALQALAQDPAFAAARKPAEPGAK